MGLKGKLEAIIYAADEPITLEHISLLMKESVLQELAAEQARASERADAQAEGQNTDDTGDVQTTFEPETGSAPAQEQTPEPDNAEPDPELLSPENSNDSAVGEGTEIALQSLPEASFAGQSDTNLPVQDAAGATEDAQAQALTPRQGGEAALAEAAQNAEPPVVAKRRVKVEIPPEVKARVRSLIEELMRDCSDSDRGMEIRQIAGGYRMATKPEHHDVVKAFVKSLKPPLRLSLPALETLAVVAYKQPVTAPEVSEIRGVDTQGVIATLLDRKLITTAGRKAVIGRPILYKTTKDFLMRFGLKDVSELPSMEEFEKLARDANSVDMFEEPEQHPGAREQQDEILSNDDGSQATDADEVADLAETPDLDTDIVDQGQPSFSGEDANPEQAEDITVADAGAGAETEPQASGPDELTSDSAANTRTKEQVH